MSSIPLENNDPKGTQTNAQILLFPARLSAAEDRRIDYLFSVRQVVEVLLNADVQYVPFGPEHAEGVTDWRGRILPVLSLESCLGMKMNETVQPTRPIVVRSVSQDSQGQVKDSYAVFQVGAAVRQLSLPLDCEPRDVPSWIADETCLRGVYQMENHLFLIPDLEKILDAKRIEN